MRTYLPLLLATSLCLSFPSFTEAARTKPVPPTAAADLAQEIDDHAGLGDRRDLEQLKFSQQLIKECQRDGVCFKVMVWTYKNRIQYYAVRLLESGWYYQVWQGPNPPMGFHTSLKWYQIYPGKTFEDDTSRMEAPRLATFRVKRPSLLNLIRYAGRRCPV